MKKFLCGALFGLALVPVIAYAEAPRDWRDIMAIHDQIVDSMGRLDRVAWANQGEAGGHMARAKEHLMAASRELDTAVAIIKRQR